MTRAWLILADLLVTILLFLSFIIFYLYVPQVTLKTTSNTIIKPISLATPAVILNWDKNMTFETLEKFNPYLCITNIEDKYKKIVEKKYTKDEIMQKYLTDIPLTQRLSELNVAMGYKVFIRIFKKESVLEVWVLKDAEYIHLKNYNICAFSGYLGPKEKEGDRQSPEGFYSVKKYQLNPNSSFHLSFNLGYPNAYDRAYNRTGSFLMVHGNCVSIGCYAMTDEKIEEIYALVEEALSNGQREVKVHAYPFKMTDENMAKFTNSKWYDFWVNLKEGYDYFELEKLPAEIKVKGKRYSIQSNE